MTIIAIFEDDYAGPLQEDDDGFDYQDTEERILIRVYKDLEEMRKDILAMREGQADMAGNESSWDFELIVAYDKDTRDIIEKGKALKHCKLGMILR